MKFQDDTSAARSHQQAGLGSWNILLTLHLPAVALGLGNGITLPIIPVLAKSFDVSVGVASLVFLAYLAGSAAGSLPTGYAIDRFGRRTVLLAGPLVVAGASVLIAFAGSFQELLLYRFIGGWGQQMWSLSRITVIADTVRSNTRGRQITSMFGAQRVGMLSGPAVGGFVAAAWGNDIPFLMHGVVATIAIVPSFFLVRETGLTTAQRQKNAAESVDTSFSLRTLLVPPIPAVLFGHFMANLTRGGFEGGGVVFLYAVYAYDTGTATLGVMSSAVAAAGIPIALAAGLIMDRFGRKWTIVPGSVLMAAAMLFAAATAFWSMPFYAFVGAFFSLHLTAGLMTGSMQTLGTDIAPPHARGRYLAVSRLIAQSGRVASPASFALFTALAGFGMAFVVMAGTAAAAAVAIGRFVPETLEKD